MNNITSFFKSLGMEFKNITWPTRRQAFLSTLFVVLATFAIAAYLGLLDALFERILKAGLGV